ncbi:MAG: hypothetical protein J7M26_05465, partial [Armatimonadetes bacterium]|nr:hypothetical protein [Armatimonadota bacterium]
VAGELDRLVVEAGLARAENRPFTVHLTLGRVRRGRRAPDLSAALEEFSGQEFGRWRAADFVLMRSFLRPEGPKYEVIERFALPGGAATTRGNEHLGA